MPSRLQGLSLIELMISITIGLLILAALTSMFVNQNRARSELDKSNRMIDNGRYALELLSSNLRMAGFFGPLEPSGTPASLPAPCDTAVMVNAAANLDVLRLHVQGYDASTSTATISSPPCSLVNSSGSVLSLKPGSDILVVRRAATFSLAQNAGFIQPPPAPQVAAAEDGTIYLQVSNCQYDATPIYRMSNSLAAFTLGQRNISGLNNCVSAGGVTTIVEPFADVFPFKVEIYFISPDNKSGDGVPTLRRLELSNDGSGNPVFINTPLVEGIEFMQLEYGIDDPAQDSDGINGAGLDGVPDGYDTCAACTLEQWSNVVSIKLHLLARNTEATPGYVDTNTYSLGGAWSYTPSGTPANYKRHAYTQVVRLVNPSGRREAP